MEVAVAEGAVVKEEGAVEVELWPLPPNTRPRSPLKPELFGPIFMVAAGGEEEELT